jgi:hypothetical protein
MVRSITHPKKRLFDSACVLERYPPLGVANVKKECWRSLGFAVSSRLDVACYRAGRAIQQFILLVAAWRLSRSTTEALGLFEREELQFLSEGRAIRVCAITGIILGSHDRRC